MLTDEQRAEAAARRQIALDALPPLDRDNPLASWLAAVRLRIARDRARAVTDPGDSHKVMPRVIRAGRHRRTVARNGQIPNERANGI